MAEEPYIPVHTEDNEPPPVTQRSAPLGFKILVGLLSLISVALLISLLVVVVQWRDIRVNALKKREHTVCVDLTELGEKMCTGELQKRGKKHCCGLTSRVVNALAERYSLEKFKDSSGARMLTETCLKDEKKYVAKISGLDVDRIQRNGEGTVIFWNESDYHGKIFQGAHYEDGYIKIDEPGYYFVHSQIVLSVDVSSQTSPTNISSSNKPFISHSLYRGPSKSPDREKLLGSMSSPCDGLSEGNEMTSYIGAVFKLNEGDVIAVETSHPQRLVNSKKSSFFGLYSI